MSMVFLFFLMVFIDGFHMLFLYVFVLSSFCFLAGLGGGAVTCRFFGSSHIYQISKRLLTIEAAGIPW